MPASSQSGTGRGPAQARCPHAGRGSVGRAVGPVLQHASSRGARVNLCTGQGITIDFHNEHGIRYASGGPRTEDGTDPTVVLLHGLGNSAEFWHAVFPLVAARRYVVALDIPGFGLSETPPEGLNFDAVSSRIGELLLAIGVDRFLLVGHSMGGIVAAATAKRWQGNASGLVLVDAHLLSAFDLLRQPLRAALRDPALAVAVAAQFLGASLRFPPSMLRAGLRSRIVRRLSLWPYLADPANAEPELLIQALVHSGGKNPFRLAGVARGTRFDELLAMINVPVWLIYGREDRLIRRQDLLIRSLVDVIEERVLEDVGHWPMLEKPGDLAAFLSDVAGE